jgi:putative transmembrane protein PGPGW
MSAWRQLVNARPGRRFIRYHEHVQKRASYLSMAVGIAVVVLGLLLSLTPGPGFVFVLLGAAILAGQSRSLARALDRFEIRLRKAVRSLRRLTETGERSGRRARAP